MLILMISRDNENLTLILIPTSLESQLQIVGTSLDCETETHGFSPVLEKPWSLAFSLETSCQPVFFQFMVFFVVL